MEITFTLKTIESREKREDPRGYIQVFLPEHKKNKSGWVSEHRSKLEVILGRYLEKEEIVHHIDHNKKNNDIHNLQLTNSEEHARLHNKYYHLKPLIFDLYKRGFSVRQIAKKLNIGKSTVQKYTSSENVQKGIIKA